MVSRRRRTHRTEHHLIHPTHTPQPQNTHNRGQKLTQRYFRGEDYVELDVDVASSAVASQIVSLCRGYARHLKVQMAIVLQGEGEAELPEKLIGCVGIDNLDINHAADGPNVLGDG